MASVQSLLAKLRRPSTAADGDRMLLARFAAMDDESAFALIVERHGPLVLGVCRRTVRDAQLAEDAFQATFLVLAKTAHRVSVKESLANWLYVVARRIAVKAARRRRANPVIEATDEIEAREDRSDLVRVLDEELERLPAKYRSPLIAFHLQDRTQDETAELLGLSLSTVRRRLDVGRERLRLRLTARGVSLGVVASVALPPALAAQSVALAVGVRSGAAVGPQLQPLLHEGLRMGTNYWKLGSILTIAAVAVGVAVSHGDEKPTGNPRKPIAAPAAVAKWSTVKGRVVWQGGGSAALPIGVTNDREHCLSKGALEPDDAIVSKKNFGLKNVWVYLRPDDNDRDAAFKPAEIHANFVNPKSKEHEVDQPCCQFVPRVLAVRVGDTVKFKNSSPIPHNVKYTSSAAIPDFNVTMPSGQTHATPAFGPDRMLNSFECNIHPWMKGMVMVFDHPYYALTDADGNFEIRNAPVGKYRIVYRHERGYHRGKDGNRGFPLEISGATTELDPLKYEEPPATK